MIEHYLYYTEIYNHKYANVNYPSSRLYCSILAIAELIAN